MSVDVKYRTTASAIGGRDSSASFPRNPTTRFSTRMSDLHPGYRTLPLNKRRDLRQFIDVFILPDPEISGRDPPSRFHRGSLSENQCRTANGATSQMN